MGLSIDFMNVSLLPGDSREYFQDCSFFSTTTAITYLDMSPFLFLMSATRPRSLDLLEIGNSSADFLKYLWDVWVT